MSYAQRLQQGIDPLRSMANKGGGGGGSSTTVQSIPEELKPLASAYTTKAIDLSNTPYTPYYGQRNADLNSTQYQGLGMVANRALNGSQTINSANNYLTNTLNGGGTNPYQGAITNVGKNAYAGQNAYLEGGINKALNDVQTRVNSQFGGNNYGTTAHQETLARGLGETENAMRMADYSTQQGLAENALNRSLNAQQTDLARNAGLADSYAQRQMAAVQMAPTLGNQAYMDAQQLMNAGQVMQDQNQSNLDFNYQQFQDAQNYPYKNLAAMSGVFGSNLGSTSTTQQSSGGK